MKLIGRLSMIALIALSIGVTAQARTKGHARASQYLGTHSKHSKVKKNRDVASAKHKKKKKAKKHRH